MGRAEATMVFSGDPLHGGEESVEAPSELTLDEPALDLNLDDAPAASHAPLDRSVLEETSFIDPRQSAAAVASPINVR